MMQQFAGFHGLAKFFFVKYSYSSQAMNACTFLIEKKKQEFKAKERTNTKFCSKLMYAVDTCYQLWLEECSTISQQNRVDQALLSFRNFVKAI
jgi:hypothetical protein